MLSSLMHVSSQPFPSSRSQLEEVAACGGADVAAGWAFAASRLTMGGDDPRPWAVAAVRHDLAERGRPSAAADGIPALLLVDVKREIDALWALEEALKSGAVSGGVAMVERAPFVMTRRLDLAARSSGVRAVLLRSRPSAELSAAAMRWRVSAEPSAVHPLDPHACGASRWRVELVRRRDGPPGTWIVENPHEAHRLDMAARLADLGPRVADRGPRRAAA